MPLGVEGGWKSPEDYALQALSSVQRRDEQAFLRLCLTSEDVHVELAQSEGLTATELEQLAWLKRLTGLPKNAALQLQESRLANFRRVCEQAEWSRGEVQSFEYRLSKRGRFIRSGGITVWLEIDGAEVGLEVDDPILLSRGWCSPEVNVLKVHHGKPQWPVLR